MTIDIAAASGALTPATGATGAAAGGQVQAGYGVSLTDFNGFQQALNNASARLEARPVSGPSETAQTLMKPFDFINTEAAQISSDAKVAKVSGEEMSPGDMVMMTMRCQEFMFHCQLTSNIANRTSDGLQQLFRQQS